MKNIMKNIVVSILVLAMLMALTACTGLVKAKEGEPQETENISEEEAIVGGWGKDDSMEVTDEIRSLVEKASARLLGAEYTPVAVIGRQIVAGTNYRILCKVVPVTPDAKETYAIVTIYEDLEGSAEITEIQNCGAEIVSAGPMGGWKEEVPGVNEASVKALEKAMESRLGTTCTEVCCLYTQVAAGTNYCLLCEITPVVPDAESHFSIVTLSEDLEGNAEITEMADFFTAE